MKKALIKYKKYLRNQKGDILQMIIVIVAVVALAVNILPGILTGVGTQGTTAVTKIETIPTVIK